MNQGSGSPWSVKFRAVPRKVEKKHVSQRSGYNASEHVSQRRGYIGDTFRKGSSHGSVSRAARRIPESTGAF